MNTPGHPLRRPWMKDAAVEAGQKAKEGSKEAVNEAADKGKEAAK